MIELEEWEKHVIQSQGLAYCGAKIQAYDWAFLGKLHAQSSVLQSSRLQPCPQCWARIQGADVARWHRAMHGEDK